MGTAHRKWLTTKRSFRYGSHMTTLWRALLIGMLVFASAGSGRCSSRLGRMFGPAMGLKAGPFMLWRSILRHRPPYTRGVNGGVYKSTNSGGSWSAASTSLTVNWVSALAINPGTPATLYAGTYGGGVFKSTDGGGSWSAANTGLTNHWVNALVIDPTTPATLYAGTNGGVYKSTNSGGNWSRRQHRPDHSQCSRPGDRPFDAGHPLCGDEWRRRV